MGLKRAAFYIFLNFQTFLRWEEDHGTLKEQVRQQDGFDWIFEEKATIWDKYASSLRGDIGGKKPPRRPTIWTPKNLQVGIFIISTAFTVI